MVVALLQRLFVAALFVALGTVGTARYGLLVAVALVVAVAALASLVGAALLRTSAIGQVSWRNVAAGWLLGWGFVFGGGSLPKIATHSGACLTLMGAIGALASPHVPLAAAWALDAAVLLSLARPFRAQSGSPSARRRLLKPLLIVLGLAVAGGVLLLGGRPQAAALVAGGPLVVIGAVYGAWLLVMITVGRNSRWN